MNKIIEVLTVGCKTYSIRCRQTGVIIEEFAYLNQAKKALIQFEQEDINEGIFELDFYQIYYKGQILN